MSATAIAPGRSLRVRTAVYPVDLPSIGDARLHSSFVVLTIHVLGQTVFGFRVSVPQIASAILASALLEVIIGMRARHRIIWPASAILTGSGVGLILRVDGTRAWDHWTWHGWHLYAGTAVVSLLTKYVLRWRGQQVFNPSNLGLLVVFLALGSSRVEPLDLWWHHWGIGIALAYAVVVVGGVLITRRLALLAMAVAFWATLGAGSAVLAASGHCITTNWSARPVCDFAFTGLLLRSPEILIFTLFMLTDPKTAPRTALRRVAFGASVAAVSLLLLAPARTEFSTKISLFGALAIVCVVRSLAPTLVPTATIRRFLATDRGGVAAGLSLPLVVSALVVSLLQFGTPARTAFASVEAVVLPDPRTAAPGLVVPNPPPVTDVAPLVEQIDPRLTDSRGRDQLARALVLGLAVEAEAVRRHDPQLLSTVDHGARLSEMRALIARGARGSHYQLDAARLVSVRAGGQGGLLVGIQASGTVTTGGRRSRVTRVFGVRPYRGDRWLIVDAWDRGEADIGR